MRSDLSALGQFQGVLHVNAHPTFRYFEIGIPEEVQATAGQARWPSGEPGEPPSYAGTDFAVVRDGKIAELYIFFDPAPA